MKNLIEKRINRAIVEKVFPGCVAGVVKRDGSRLIMAFGRHTYDPASPPMQAEAIFDVASITKAIPTSSLALTLLDAGKLKLDDKLITFVPEFRNSFRKSVRIRHLLTHTLDFGFRLSAYKDKNPKNFLRPFSPPNSRQNPARLFIMQTPPAFCSGLWWSEYMGKTLQPWDGKYSSGPWTCPGRHFTLRRLPGKRSHPRKLIRGAEG